ncbi:hypothetical protein FKG94_16205, partial [Exilibacterium tricleocarpae]
DGDGAISYRSSDTGVATVDAEGKVTARGAGSVMITADKAADARYAAASASYEITVSLAVQTITFEQAGPLELLVGGTLRNPASGGDGTGDIHYHSSDPAVVTVDATGKVTVTGAGSATITANKEADARYAAAEADYDIAAAPATVVMSAWIGSSDTLVDFPASASGLEFYRSSKADCDLENYPLCSDGQFNTLSGQTVTDTAARLTQAGHYILRHGANEAALTVNAEHFSKRAEHQVVEFKGKLWLVGGDDGDDIWSSRDGVTWVQEETSAGFGPRFNHQVVVFDDKLWLVGGAVRSGLGGRLNDVWSSSNGVDWTQVTPNAAFSARAGHQVVVFKNELWLVGGFAGEGKNDVWSSEDGREWAQVVTDEVFSPRFDHQVVVFKDKLWMVSGYEEFGSEAKNNVWSSEDGKTWKQEVINSNDFSARDAREAHQVVVFKDKLWLVGGYEDYDGDQNDVWSSSNGVDWTQAAPNAAFSPSADHQVVAFNDKLWLVGGSEDFGQKNGDVWSSLDGITWARATTNAAFSPRDGHQVVAFNDKLWLVGGYDGRVTNDVWSSPDGIAWTQEETGNAVFSPRQKHQVVVFDNKLWVIGGLVGDYYGEELALAEEGEGESDYTNDVWWSSDGIEWNQVLPSGDVFSPRFGHQVVVLDGKLWLVGGIGGEFIEAQTDVWSSENGSAWTQVSTTAPARSGEDQVVVFDGKLWLVGSEDVFGEVTNSVWSSQDGDEWSSIPNDVAFPGRMAGYQVVAFDDRLWLVGGLTSDFDGGLKNDVWSSLDGSEWTQVPTSEAFPPRYGHQVVVFKNKLWLVGGIAGFDEYGELRNDVWASSDGGDWRKGFRSIFQWR